MVLKNVSRRKSDEPETTHEDYIPMPVTVEEQESTPDLFEEKVEEIDDHVVIKREVHRKFLPVEKQIILDEKPSDECVEEKGKEPGKVDEPEETHEDYIPMPVTVEEQESTPDLFEEKVEEMDDHVVFKREVHRKVLPVEKQTIVEEKPSEDEMSLHLITVNK